MAVNKAIANERRANAARAALDAYGKTKGYASGQRQDLRERMIDLLTDLRHLARESGIDFDSMSSMSRFHFDEEVDSEPRPD
jgi:hypothetical protein